VRIAVVHLAWAGIGDEHLGRFADSYRAHPAGIDHTLVIAWKGYSAERLAAARRVLDGIGYADEECEPDPLDLSSYREVADRLDSDEVCFLNSYCEIEGDQWLAKLAHVLTMPNVGLVGATGSYETPLAERLPLRRLLRAGKYAPFPNEHIRTNAFMLGVELMRDLDWPRVENKEVAYQLEAGLGSITRQVRARELETLVVGRDGVGYPPERWPHSATFRAGGQANLLIADNRTQQYSAATGRQRRRLSRLAWGDAAVD
jgi:hypothetical protein